MKDALGHGSDERGGTGNAQAQRDKELHGMMRQAFPYLPDQKIQERIAGSVSGNHPKSAPVQSHEANEYNRDLALRARNGQVGSGMKFRG